MTQYRPGRVDQEVRHHRHHQEEIRFHHREAHRHHLRPTEHHHLHLMHRREARRHRRVAIRVSRLRATIRLSQFN